VKDSNLLKKEYKQFAGYPSHNGFFSKTSASHLFLALYEHFALQGKDANDIIDVDTE